MTKLTNTFEGGTTATAVTAANSGGVSGTPFTATANVNYTSARAAHGSLSAESVAADGSAGQLRWALANEAKALFALDVYLGATSTVDLDLMRFSITGDTTAVTVRVNAAGKLRLSLPGSVFPWTAASNFPINQWVRIELYAEPGPGTADGKARLAYFLGDSTTAVEDSGLLTGLNTGNGAAGAVYVNARMGKLSPSGYTATVGFDNAAVHTGTDAVWPIGPWAAAVNASPTVSAGPDQTNVEPWSTVTLTGTDSDSDGTIASRAWTQTGGSPAVTLAGTGASRTFEAPATIPGTTLTFQYAATDNAGATTSDTMTVAVLPVTERAVIGGVEVPMRIVAASGVTAPPAGITRVDTSIVANPSVGTHTADALTGVQPGDLLLVASCASLATLPVWSAATYDGWNLAHDLAEPALTARWLWRIADGTAADAFPAIATNATAHRVTTAATYRGVHPTNPFIAQNARIHSEATATLHQAPALTNGVNPNAWGVFSAFFRQGSVYPSSWANHGPSLVEQEDASTGLTNTNDTAGTWADTNGPIATSPVTFQAESNSTTAQAIMWAALLRPAA